MVAESGQYNVYTVAASRAVRTLTGGLDLVPHLSFDQLAARLHGDPDIVVVPQIVDIGASINAPVVAWVGRQGQGHALLFFWYTGAEGLDESGAIVGKAATAHWVTSTGVRYVDGGTLLSTAGLTAGVDATLHLLARRPGSELAAGVAEALHIPPSTFVETGSQRPTRSIPGPPRRVVSSHGIRFAPREQVRTVPKTGRSNRPPSAEGDVDVLLRSEGSGAFAYTAAVEDLARRQDAWTAGFAAKRLEIGTPLRLEGDSLQVQPFGVL